MSDQHEEWESRIQRGTFLPADWARDVKRDIAAYQVANAALRKEADENEGADPMSNEYKRLDYLRNVAASNVHRHLNHGVMSVIAGIVGQFIDQDEVDWSVVREAIEDTADEHGTGTPKQLQRSFKRMGLTVTHAPEPSTETP